MKRKVILIGAGNRGVAYTEVMADMPDKFQVVAVAEPIKSRRDYIKEKHSLSEDMCFEDYKELLALGKIADVAIIATMDRSHFEPTMKAIELNYDILLEKPVSPSIEECKNISLAAKRQGVSVIVCHVLRFTPMFNCLKEVVDSGRIGKIMSINHEECVGNIHQTHSFVRGNWGNSKKSSPMLLQKSCHDLDILQWLIGKPCRKVQSFGFLSHFTAENAPEGAPDYCYQGCPVGDSCPYNAIKVYYDDKENDWFRTTCTREAYPTDDMVMNTIKTTRYGKCAYKCDNDVVDHQTVNMLFGDDVTVTFTMNCFNKGGRFMHIMGTKGEIRAAIDGETPIEIYDFETREQSIINICGKDGIEGGHGGGDIGIVNAIYEHLEGTYKGKSIPTIEESVSNHMIVFAAEESRKTGMVVDFDDYVKTHF